MQHSPQKKEIGFIIKLAFSYWQRTLLFQVLFGMLYLSVFFLVATFFMNQYGILDQYMAIYQQHSQDLQAYQAEITKLAEKSEFQRFFWILFATAVFLFPLNLGLFKIFRKLDLKEKPTVVDLFAGYSGINFFIYTSFYLFWLIIYMYALPTVIFAVIWILLTLFTAPLMFFTNRRFFDTFSVSVRALRLYFFEILVCMFVAVVFKYVGVLTFFGMFFSFSFVTTMIYALYQVIFSEEAEKRQLA